MRSLQLLPAAVLPGSPAPSFLSATTDVSNCLYVGSRRLSGDTQIEPIDIRKSLINHDLIELPILREEANSGHATFIDLDELVHALSAFLKIIQHMFTGGANIWDTEAELLGRSTNAYTAFQIAIEGSFDLIVAGIATTFSIVLGGLAAHCGWEELTEANEKAPELKEKLASLKQQLNDIQGREKQIDAELQQRLTKSLALQTDTVLLEKDFSLSLEQEILQAFSSEQRLFMKLAPENLERLCLLDQLNLEINQLNLEKKWVSTEKSCLQQKIDATLSEIEMNLYNNGIGLASLVSGTTIALKATIEAATQIILMVSNHTIDIAHLITEGLLTTAQATLATAVGMASTFVFTPLAAACAVKLGFHFVKKSIALHNMRQEGRKEFDVFLKEMEKLREQTPYIDQYLTWLDEKLKQGEKFDNEFLDSNLLFLGSSIFYTAGVIAKAALVTAALAGLTALAANPVAHGITLMLLVTSSLVMARYSLQFLSGHEGQKNYDSYRTEDAVDLDRHFLAGVDLKLNKEEGVKLRAKLLQYYQTREEAQQEFLKKVSHNRTILGMVYRKDAEPTEELLESWLAEPEGSKALIEFMHTTLTAQQKYLQQKNAVYNDMERLGGIPDKANKEKDSQLEEQITLLLDVLKEPSLPTPKELVGIKKYFIYCQNAQVVETTIKLSETKLLNEEENTQGEQEVNQYLAQHLLDKSYQASFDKLVETELQARELCKEKGFKPESVATQAGIIDTAYERLSLKTANLRNNISGLIGNIGSRPVSCYA